MYGRADSRVSVEGSQQILGLSRIHSLILRKSAAYLVFWALDLLNRRHSPAFDDLILSLLYSAVIHRLKKDKKKKRSFVFPASGRRSR